MDCDVCIGGYGDEGDYPEFYNVAVVRARKPHECCECRRTIAPAERYERCTGKWDGELGTFATCLLCEEIRRVFCCGESWSMGQFWEEMRDYAFPRLTLHSPCFRNLSPEAKAFVLSRWREWKGLPD